jgi:hypothetical protein
MTADMDRQLPPPVAPLPPPLAQSPSSASMPLRSASMARTTPSWIALAASGLVVLGAFGPWASMMSVFGRLDVSGFDGGDGKITALIGASLVILFWVRTTATIRVVRAVMAACVAVVGLIDLGNINHVIDASSSEYARVSVGWGLWGTLLGSAVAFALAIVVKDGLQRPRR